MTMPIVAEFDDADRVVAAAARLRELGFVDLEAYTPFSLPALDEVLGLRRTRVPIVGLIGGTVGAMGAYFIMFWTTVVDYPLNVGGRPYDSVPTYIPIIFESTDGLPPFFPSRT